MPKDRSKKKKDKIIDQFDASSVASLQSDESELLGSVIDTEDESMLQSTLDEIPDIIESLYSKRSETRVKALRTLIKTFERQFFYLDFSWNYIETLLSVIENIIRRGKITDQALACDLLVVFLFQFDFEHFPTFYARFLSILEPVIRDNATPCVFRASAATALAVLQSFSGYCDFVLMLDIMKIFESIFKSSAMKVDGKVPVFNDSISLLHVTALRGWTLMYSFLTRFDACPVGEVMLSSIANLLQASNIDFRLSAGETCALIYERLRTELNAQFRGSNFKLLIGLLKELSLEGSKMVSKNDRKRQRFLFRDVLDTVAHGTSFDLTISFGRESLVLSSNVDHFRYNFLRCVLSGGMQIHLRDNINIRALFELGPPIQCKLPNGFDRRLARDQRKMEYCIASKQRTKVMSNYRDKRDNMLNKLV